MGVFDGVHRGHRRILEAAVRQAERIKGRSLVLTFFPHPQKEKSLYSLRHRLKLIGALGVDVCVVVRFNRLFSQIPAEDFVKDILINKVGAKYIFVGRNFRFGKQARGDSGVLERLSHIYNFKLRVFDIVKTNNRPISSTYIRRLITEGKLNAARRLLSRPVSLLGTVIKGTSLARELGFPTANIDPHHEVLPPSGVYAVSALLNNFRNKELNGVCYIGTKPTFKSHGAYGKLNTRRYVEAHIFNFNRDIYGRDLEIQFIKKIRSERRFSSLAALAGQIKKDVKFAQRIFSLHC